MKLNLTSHILLGLAILVPCSPLKSQAAPPPPNIVFIIADDLGYGELGSYGQKLIKTPHLDKLTSEGMKFTQHYSGSPVCAPSRCVLMTGKHPGHAWVRNNREDKPEGQFPLPDGAVTIAKLLKARGYTTGAFGKWGLGGPHTNGRPLKQGFDRFYGYNCQRIAHNYYPLSLWDDEREVQLNNKTMPMSKPLPADADPNSTESYSIYKGNDYSADLIADKAREFVRQNHDKPFFLFYPTTVPHLALQVPDDSLAEYQGLWPETPYTGGHGYLPNKTPRATYAAMITRMDREIGRLLQLLDELKLSDNTIVVFTSDNGPVYPGHGGTDPEFFQSAGNLRAYKGSLYEGGIRVPCIVRWKGKVAPGSITDAVTGFEDWLPTLLDLADARESRPQDADGISFFATLTGKQQTKRPYLYREFPGYEGQQSVRVGDWKLIRQNLMPGKKQKPQGEPTMELFNIATDPSEKTDVADQHPEIVSKLRKIMAEQHVPSEHFPFPVLDQ